MCLPLICVGHGLLIALLAPPPLDGQVPDLTTASKVGECWFCFKICLLCSAACSESLPVMLRNTPNYAHEYLDECFTLLVSANESADSHCCYWSLNCLTRGSLCSEISIACLCCCKVCNCWRCVSLAWEDRGSMPFCILISTSFQVHLPIFNAHWGKTFLFR